MKKLIRNYLDKSKAEEIEQNIQTSINAIVSKCSALPYDRQLEAVNRIKEGLSKRKSELEEELSELDSVINKL